MAHKELIPNKMKNYSADITEFRRSIRAYAIRAFVVLLLLVLGAFADGLFQSRLTTTFVWIGLGGLVLYMLSTAKKYYLLKLVGLNHSEKGFELIYLKWFRSKSCFSYNLEVKAKIGLQHYSTKSVVPIKCSFITDDDQFDFYIELRELIKVLIVVKSSEGHVPADFEFITTLKELSTHPEYADLKSELNELFVLK